MAPIDKELIKILAEASSASDAIHRLYQHRKTRNNKLSLAQICKFANISSRGYLSDIMNGRRTLHPKYLDGICRAFNIQGQGIEIMRLLLALERIKDSKSGERLQQQLNQIRSSFNYEYVDVNAKHDLEEIDLLSSLALFKDKQAPLIDELAVVFGKEREVEMRRIIGNLLARGTLRQDEEQRIHLAKDKIWYTMDWRNEKHRNFSKRVLGEGLEKLHNENPASPDTTLYTIVISAKKDEYKTVIDRVREKLMEAAHELESPTPDCLLRLNVQIYNI